LSGPKARQPAQPGTITASHVGIMCTKSTTEIASKSGAYSAMC
jgi:hypothetical protein